MVEVGLLSFFFRYMLCSHLTNELVRSQCDQQYIPTEAECLNGFPTFIQPMKPITLFCIYSVAFLWCLCTSDE